MFRSGGPRAATITLTTDFGTRDHYVACMKGVILQINPAVRLVDVTHEIAPHGVVEGAFILRQVFPWFPPGTIHVAVVDPGVGTQRRILVGRYSDRYVIAPDNGLISLVHRDAELQELRSIENRGYFGGTLSPTFHGRDVMGPVAAHLASGIPLHQLGPSTDHLEILSLARPRAERDGRLCGEVLYVDVFGNLITNISLADLNGMPRRRERREVFVGECRVGPVQSTYADVRPGEAIALLGSSQMLEVAVNQGSAASHFSARVGTPVSVRCLP